MPKQPTTKNATISREVKQYIVIVTNILTYNFAYANIFFKINRLTQNLVCTRRFVLTLINRGICF